MGHTQVSPQKHTSAQVMHRRWRCYKQTIKSSRLERCVSLLGTSWSSC